MNPNDTPDLELRQHAVRGRSLRIATRPGTRPGPPLLLVNGVGAGFEILLPFIGQLPERGIIAFDAPGVGGSRGGPALCTPTELAALVSELLQQLGHDTVDLLGVSWGGLIAQQFALQHPQQLRRLVLVATGVSLSPTPGGMSLARAWTDPRLLLDARYRAGLLHDLLAAPVPASAWGLFGQLVSTAGWNTAPWLHRVRQPTLILAGEHDAIAPPANARLLQSLIAGSRLQLIDGSHLLLSTRSEACARAVQAFLADGPAAG